MCRAHVTTQGPSWAHYEGQFSSNVGIVLAIRPAKLLQRRTFFPQSGPGDNPTTGLFGGFARKIGNLWPNNKHQRRTCYALCHILYPVSAACLSIFRMDSNATSYRIRKLDPRHVLMWLLW